MGRRNFEARLVELERRVLRLGWEIRGVDAGSLFVEQKLREAEVETEFRDRETEPPGPNVMIWFDDIAFPSGSSYDKTTTILDSVGIPYDVRSGTVTFSIFRRYTLVVWNRANADAPWLDYLPDWTGRILMCGESNHVAGNLPEIAYINGLMTSLGYALQIVPAHKDTPFPGDPCPNGPRPVDAHALTAGVTCLTGVGTSLVSGGDSLSRTFCSDETWLAVERIGDVEIVLGGDSVLLGAGAVNPSCGEEQFFVNCAQPLA